MNNKITWFLAILMFTTLFAGCIDNSATDVEENSDSRDDVFAACSGGIENKSECNLRIEESGVGDGPMQPVELHDEGEDGHEHNGHSHQSLTMPSYEVEIHDFQSNTGGRSGCTSEDIVGLTNADLHTYLIEQTDACLSYLWSLNANVESVLTDSNIQWIANSIEEIANTYEGNNNEGLHQLLFFVRIAYYYDFYNQINPLSQATFDEAYAAIDSLKDSDHILDEGDEARKNLKQMIILADTAAFGEILIPHFITILQTMTDGDTDLDHYWTASTVYSTMFCIKRSTDKPNFNAHENLVELLERMGELSVDADETLISGDEEWLVNWAIWGFARLGLIYDEEPTLYDLGCQYIIAAENHHYSEIEYTVPFLWAVHAHDHYYNYYDSDTCVNPVEQFSMDSIRDSLEEQLFPNTFVFDDGHIVIRTSLSVEDITPLYYATKEVKAQFFRLSESSLPVDEDPNHNITMIIYGSRAAYRAYHPLIYGISSNNGGIYIEQWGKFFTYQRTPDESIYTLEELVRHEYAHYLANRHIIHGMWGENEIYDGNRLTWFDEGLAEFLTGSTKRDGIEPRLSVLQRINNDGQNRLTTDQIFSSTYNSGPKFYRYGAALFDFMYHNHNHIIRDLFGCLNNDDADCFDSIVNGLASDDSFEEDYQLHIDQMLLLLDSYSSPTAEFLENDNLAYIETAFVENEIRRTSRYGYDVECDFAVKDNLQRYRCIGTLHLNNSDYSTTEETWPLFNKHLNKMMNDISGNPELPNLDDAICWFDRILIEPSIRSTFDHRTSYHCEIPLPQGQYFMEDVFTQLNEDINRTRANGSIECIEGDGNDLYRCNIHVESEWFESSSEESLWIESLEYYSREIANQIHAANPATYARTICSLSEDYQYHDVETNYIYISSNLQCDWHIGDL